AACTGATAPRWAPGSVAGSASLRRRISSRHGDAPRATGTKKRKISEHRGLEPREPCRLAPARPGALDQAALTSIILGFTACGVGTLTSRIPFAYFASTWVASTPSGRVTLR